MLKHIEVRGSEYDCGYQIGRQMKAAVHRRLDRLVPDRIFKKCESDLKKVHATCERKYPRFIAQLRGMADGANVDYWRILLLNAAELRTGKVSCTDIAEVIRGQALLTHNEDTGSTEGDHRQDCALVTNHLKGYSYTSFTYAGELSGNAYSWNSYGLFFSVNYLDPIRPKPLLNRTPRDFSARALIEAKNLGDAIRILRSSPDASGYHYYIGFKNRIVSVEQFQSKISVKEVKGVDAHANHYIHPKFAKGAPISKNSKFRQKRAEELLKQKTAPLKILTDRKDAPYAICRLAQDDGLTLSTVQFSPAKKRVVVFTPKTLKKEYSFRL